LQLNIYHITNKQTYIQTTGKITDLCILVFTGLDSKMEYKYIT
jgi:hypothetical protein